MTSLVRGRLIVLALLVLGLVGLVTVSLVRAHIQVASSATSTALPATPVPVSTPVAAAAATTQVGVAGERFTLNGTPTFLLGVSYFDGRSWKPSDLDQLQAQGFNLLRIWLDWEYGSYYISSTATLDPIYRQRLLDLVDAADQRGIVVEVALLDTKLSFPKASAPAAIREAATALKDRNNVIYDLVNEFDHSQGPFTTAELGELAKALRSVDPDAIYTVSSTEYYLIDSKDRVRSSNVAGVVKPPVNASLLTPHLPRTDGWAAKTGDRVRALRATLQALGLTIPIYLNEDARRGFGGRNPSREEFVEAALQARDSGAAGWIFHTRAGFDLAYSSFFDNLDDVERSVVATLSASLASGGIAPAPALTPTPLPQSGDLALRLNSGGPTLDLPSGRWLIDQYSLTGANSGPPSSIPIDGTEEDLLYQYDRNGKTFSYAIPLPVSGNYLVRLHFAELFFTSKGRRVFDVNAEGGSVELPAFDIVASAGSRRATVKQFAVPVRDGVLNLEFTASKDKAKINAIELIHTSVDPPAPSATAVLPTPDSTATPSTTAVLPTSTAIGVAAVARINAGGPAQRLGDVSWSADRDFSGGTMFKRTGAVAGTDADVLYETERTGSKFRYSLPVPEAGSYLVRLHFAEIYWSSAGKRVFSVSLENGQARLDNFDIVAQVGTRTALVKEFTLSVSDGVLDLDFAASKDKAKISAIEVLRQ